MNAKRILELAPDRLLERAGAVDLMVLANAIEAEVNAATRELIDAARDVLGDYRCAIDSMEYPDEADESRALALRLGEAIKAAGACNEG